MSRPGRYWNSGRVLPGGAIAELLHQHGFGQITDFWPDQARAAYFPGQAGVEIAGAQRLIAATAGGNP